MSASPASVAPAAADAGPAHAPAPVPAPVPEGPAGEFVISAPPFPSLPVAGTAQRFPVRRVYCVGRNYAAHAIEMGHDPDREDPFFFQKNPDGLVPGGGAFPYPAATSDASTTRSSWSWLSRAAARTSRSRRPSHTSTATRSGST